MEIRCPECDASLSADDTNVRKDVAVCPECDEAFSISERLAAEKTAADDFDLGQPPPGVSFEQTALGWRLTSSARTTSAPQTAGFAIVWATVVVSIIGMYVASGEYGWGPSIGCSLFSLITMFVVSWALMAVFGKVVVSVERGEGRIFTGIGPIGWTRRFDWNTTKRVKEEPLTYGYSGSTGLAIALIGQTHLHFGGMLTHPRREFLIRALRKLLRARGR